MDEELKEVLVTLDLPCKIEVLYDVLHMLKNAESFDFESSFVDYNCREAKGGDVDLLEIHGLMK